MVDSKPPSPAPVSPAPISPAPISPALSTGSRHLTTVPLRPRHPAGHAHPEIVGGSVEGPALFEQLRRQDRELRHWHLRVRTFAMAEGLSVDRDGLTVVLAVLLEAQRHGGPQITWWTVERVGQMAWSGCAGWAARSGARLPAGTASALSGFWGYLAAQSSFSPGSDTLEALVDALRTHTDPARRAPSRKHPSIRKQNVRV